MSGFYDANGNLMVNVGAGALSASNPSVGTDGAAAPASSTQIGGSDGVNLQPLQVDASKNLKVNIAAGTLTASNPSVGTDGAAIPASSTQIGASDGVNLQQLLVESAANHNLRVGIYAGATEAAVSANGLKVDGSAVTQPISGIVSVQHGNVVSAVNSSTALLGSNAVFTGTGESSLLFSAISVEVFADQASAAGGLVVQQSQNGTNWDTTDSFSITASTPFSTIVNLVGQFFQIKYTNGAVAQGAFRLQVIKQASESVLPRSLTALGNLKVAMQEGSITANAGTNLNTSLLALESGGHLATIDTSTAASKTDLDGILTNTNAFKDTSATGTVTLANDAVSIALPGGQATVLVQILMGTLVGTLNFEGSPDSGTTWYAISGKAVGSSSFASTATAAGAWQFNVSGMTNFRVRLGPVTSGTSGTITIRLSQGVSNLAINNASTLGQAVMTSSAPVVIASDQSAVKVKADFVELTGNGPGVVNAVNTDLFGWTDVSGYKSFSVQTTGTWVGTLTIQGSNDGATAVALYGMTPVSGGMTQVLSSNSIFTAPVTTHYIRVRMTTFTSNASLVGLLDLFTFPAAFVSTLASQQGTWTAQPGNTQNTTPWLVNTPGSDITVFASGAQTATQTQADQTNNSARGIRVVLDVTVAGTGSVTLEIDAKDVASGKYTALLTGTAVTTVTTIVYEVYPGLTAVANATANDVLPHTWRIKVTANNANSVTYSVGASLLP